MFLGLLHLDTLPLLNGPLLMRHPTVNQSSIVFSFAGDLWSVSRAGGQANRLTTSAGSEMNPYFSPDGKWIAFTGQYSGNSDVYVMPAEGGEPRRLTYFPGGDIASGWTPDGKRVVYSSTAATTVDIPQLWSVSVEGGQPERLPFPSGLDISFSADGSRIAYGPGFKWQNAWKRYRGGQTTKIWIADMADSKVKEIPRDNSNDSDPMWVGDKIFFLSDRNGPVTLFSYDTKTNRVSQCLENDGFDMKSATAWNDVVALEQLGEIKLYDIKSGQATKVDVQISGEFPEARPQYKDNSKFTLAMGLSPSGVRAIFAARGDIWTVPASKGDARNLTQSSDSCERDPAWSPDGQKIAYLSDSGGGYKLVVRDAVGKGGSKSYNLDGNCFYYTPNWSPDSQKIAYTDNRHNLWYLDLKTGKSALIDTNPYENPTYVLSCVWSKDSKWVAYHRDLDSHVAAVFLYNLDSGKTTQVTDGLSDAKFPVFDNSGKYLYFAASTNSGPSTAWLDLSSYRNFNSQSNIYCAVLRNDLPSPLAPESDDEKPKTDAKPEEKKDDFRIDLDGLDQRIIALPIPAKNYGGLFAGPAESLLLTEIAPLATIVSQPRATFSKFSFADKSVTPLTSGYLGVTVTPGGDKALLFNGAGFQIVSTAAPMAPGQGAIDTSGMVSIVEPMQEWKQMFHEAWRVQRDFLYAPNYHGIDLSAMERKYEPFVANIRSRADLNYLFEDMLGEICVGHMFISGGDIPGVEGVSGGLLGADYELDKGRYRFARVYSGENWNPSLRAPLTEPGVNVKAGEYLLAIDGVELRSDQSIHQRLEAKAGKQVVIKVGKSVDGTGSREVTVVPIGSEAGLRLLAWREDNRRTVEKLSGGKLGYMHIPDTNIGGWTNFNRYFYAQLEKQGIIVDERFNHGGQVDDFMVDNLQRPLMSMWTSRYGKDFPSPFGQIYGPKVMIINEYAGSGGDYFPWHFKKAKVGPVVGKRTWGGLVGILNFPTFIDGGSVTAPNIAFYNPDGKWEVENYGVDPDIDVEFDPALWRQGRDAQLERAVAEAMKLLSKNPKPSIKKPAYPDKSSLGKLSR
ncbi:MAG: PD40 domain-containing protein [Chthonomonadaceae bacterium]|nr:PD40 domain-containing protein [Chthonomonadaceae bacterium]